MENLKYRVVLRKAATTIGTEGYEGEVTGDNMELVVSESRLLRERLKAIMPVYEPAAKTKTKKK